MRIRASTSTMATLLLLSRSAIPAAAAFSSRMSSGAVRTVASASASASDAATMKGRATFLMNVFPTDDARRRRRSRRRTPATSAVEMTSDSDSTTAAAAATDLSPYENKSNVRDQVFSAMSSDGGIKVTACTVRNLVNDVMMMHSLTAVPADALGRAMACSVLLSNGMQDEQVFQMTVDGDGPLRGVVSISDGLGQVRGYVGTPALGDIPLKEAVGKGVIKVVKNHPTWPNPYNGISAMSYMDIDRDVGIYLAESEQRSCALAAATSVSGILCKAAGGYLVERLPDCPDETMRTVEVNLARLVERDGTTDAVPTGLLLDGVTPLEIAEVVLEGLGMEPLQQIEPRAKCRCSEERLLRSLRLLPRAEVEEILAKEEQIEARCQFCGRVYRMGPDEVRARMEEAKGDPSKDGDVEL